MRLKLYHFQVRTLSRSRDEGSNLAFANVCAELRSDVGVKQTTQARKATWLCHELL
jgi:hypothetical protein